MRFRAIPVLTNTPLRGPQRGSGESQLVPAIEPMIDKAARELKIDRVQIRKINAPDNNGKFDWDPFGSHPKYGADWRTLCLRDAAAAPRPIPIDGRARLSKVR